MKTTLHDTQQPLLTRLVTRAAAFLVGAPVEVATKPRRERYGHPSGMLRVELVRSAALAEAARRATRLPGGAAKPERGNFSPTGIQSRVWPM